MRLLCLLAFLFSFTAIGHSQTRHHTGLIFNDSLYEALPRLSIGAKLSVVNPTYSLEKYAPYAGNQGVCSSCVGWACGYACLSMSFAIKHKTYDRAKITKMANSAMYVYVQIANDCESGAVLPTALENLKSHGDCLLKDFNPSQYDSSISDLIEKASKYKVASFTPIFDINDGLEKKIYQTQLALENDKPVMIGATIYSSFEKVSNLNSIWHPNLDSERELGKHALCVIGYDSYKRLFKILNSWGESWGENGFFYIDYDDYAKIVQYGITMEVN